MTVLNVDFTDVETGAGYLPAGSYTAKVASVEVKVGQKADFLNWCFVSTQPGTEGMVSYLMTSLADKALWKLKRTLEALGAEIPQSKLKLDTDKFIGRVGVIHVVDEPYVGSDGQTRSSFKIQDVFPASKSIAETMADEAAAPIGSDPLGYEDPRYDDITF
jgi:hypothetical protein